MKKGVLIAFGELFLKSEGVKRLFEKKLIYDLSFFLKKENIKHNIYNFRERIFIATDNANLVIEKVKNIPGIAWISECFFFPKTNLKELGNFIDKNYKNWIKKGETFGIKLKISGVLIKEAQNKIIERVAKNIERRVDLNNPQKELFIEIKKNGWFLFFKKETGLGGLPSGSSGKVLALTSGGIDSPVAGYLISKRGAENIWLHFHSFPLVSNKSIEKVKELANIFLNQQRHLKIYYVPFSKIQLEIKAKAPEQYRILLYRRMMLRIAEIIAKKEDCKALVTGESLGQVSSQTLPNLNIIEETIKTPVLRPLIATDKEEIIKLAKNIGTYQISIKPQEDCCTLFTPKHASGQGKIGEIKLIEKKLNIKKLVKEALHGIIIEQL